jgi:hypothetical protein
MKRFTLNAFNVLIFLVGFLFAASFRFQHVVYEEVRTDRIFAVLIAVSAISGISLGWFLKRLKLFPASGFRTSVLGAALGYILFFGLFSFEDRLSEKRLHALHQPSDFGYLRGHCGVYLARAMDRVYDSILDPSVRNQMKEVTIANHCRIHHLKLLDRSNQLGCDPEKDQVQCLLRWMDGFSEHGFWDVTLRRFFFSRVAEIYLSETPLDKPAKGTLAPTLSPDGKFPITSKNSYLEYALRDHELELARPSFLEQAGLKEEFTDQYEQLRTQEELENAIATRDIINFVEKAVRPINENESPTLRKFAELTREIKAQAEKIPELKRDLEGIKTRSSQPL